MKKPKPKLYVGIDVSGKGSDYTAVSCLKPDGVLIYCARLPHSDFKAQIQQLTPITDGPRFTPRRIFVDGTGLGVGFVESLRERSLNPDINSITITAGKNAREAGPLEYNVSKHYLMECLSRALNTGWLKIRSSPDSDELRQELNNFMRKQNGKIEASGSGKDDLVLSLAIAVCGVVLSK